MNAYTGWIIRRPIVTLVIFGIITIILSLGIFKLEFDTSIEAFLPKKDSEFQYYNKVKEIYGDIDTFVILAVSQDHLWSHRNFVEMDNLLSDLEEYEHYDGQRENRRLIRLESFLSRNDVTYGELAHVFQDDPAFLRFIRRNIGTRSDEKPVSKREIRKLNKKAVHSSGIKKQEMISEIISPLTAKDIAGMEDTLETVQLIQKDAHGRRLLPVTPADFQEFRNKLLRNPVFEKGIYSRDPKTGEITDFGFIIRFKSSDNYDMISREILNIVDNQTHLKITSQGQPLIYIWINDYLQKDLFRLLALAMFVTILVCYLNFGSIRGTLLPFLSLGMATSWLLGLMGHLGYKLTTVGISLPPLMISVGSSYAIHVLHQYYTDFDLITERGKETGLIQSMHHIGLTVFLAGLTTLVSFLTLANHQLSGIRQWGAFSALGVLFAIFISVTFIPAALALMPHRKGKRIIRKERSSRKSPADKLIAWATAGSVHHPRKVLAVIAVLICISIAGILKLKVETEFLQYFKEDDPIRASEKIVGDKFGGRWGFNILIDSGEPGGVRTSAYLKTLSRVREWLVSDRNPDLNVGRTDAFTDYIRTMHMAMNNDNPSFFNIPDNDGDIRDYLEIYSDVDANSDGRVDSYEAYVDPEFKTCNILTRLNQKEGYLIGTGELKRISQKISDYLKQTLPAGYSFHITGHPSMVIKSADYIASGQIQSLWQSWIVVGIVILLLVRSVKAGFLALIPLSVAFIINFGIMGLFGIKLDVATSIIAAITIGIGDDNTIHFINTFTHLRRENPLAGFDELISATLSTAGKAIIFTSLALALGFSVFTISSFKPLILFGMLMTLSITATNVGALLVLPSIINVFRLNLVEPGEIRIPVRIRALSGFRLGVNSLRALTTLLWNGMGFKR